MRIRIIDPNRVDLSSTVDSCLTKLRQQCNTVALGKPDEPIDPTRPSPNARGLTAVTRYGLGKFSDLFTTRQLVFLMETVRAVQLALRAMSETGYLARNKTRQLVLILGCWSVEAVKLVQQWPDGGATRLVELKVHLDDTL